MAGCNISIRAKEILPGQLRVSEELVKTRVVWLPAIVKYSDDTQFTAYVSHPLQGGLRAFRVDSDCWRLEE